MTSWFYNKWISYTGFVKKNGANGFELNELYNFGVTDVNFGGNNILAVILPRLSEARRCHDGRDAAARGP